MDDTCLYIWLRPHQRYRDATPLIKAGFKLGLQADSARLPITTVPPSPQPSWLEQGGSETAHQ